jgi:hypothetical protein
MYFDPLYMIPPIMPWMDVPLLAPTQPMPLFFETPTHGDIQLDDEPNPVPTPKSKPKPKTVPKPRRRRTERTLRCLKHKQPKPYTRLSDKESVLIGSGTKELNHISIFKPTNYGTLIKIVSSDSRFATYQVRIEVMEMDSSWVDACGCTTTDAGNGSFRVSPNLTELRLAVSYRTLPWLRLVAINGDERRVMHYFGFNNRLSYQQRSEQYAERLFPDKKDLPAVIPQVELHHMLGCRHMTEDDAFAQ